MSTVILAFSGGLDTSFCIPFLMEQGHDVITVTVNTGGFSAKEMKEIEKGAKKLGSKKHIAVDAKKPLYDKIGSYLIKANYLKGGVYPACVGPERTIIAEEMAKVAKKEKTKVVAHGSTGAGNDQVRFDLALHSLIPNCTILAPIREEGFTRNEEYALLKKYGVTMKKEVKDYSINVGLLGTTIGGKETKGTAKPLPAKAFPNVVPVAKAPAKAVEVKITFKKGLPVALNGKKLSGVEMIQTLNALGAKHGFGKGEHIGTTIIGIKGRIGFEAPAMLMLIHAHSELEKIVLTGKQLFWKHTLGNVYGDLMHEGLYFEPLARDIEAMLDSSSDGLDGVVKMQLHKGTLVVTGIESPHSLFNAKKGTYGEEAGAWNGKEAAAFCKLYGLESANAYSTQQ